jgi:hypothetical protein
LQMHVDMTQQMMAQINGQTNVPTQPNPHNVGEAINGTASVAAPSTGGV